MPGKIKVKILAGRNLPVMDRSGDTTDAYVELKFGNVTYKTDVCRKSLNPQWNSEWYRFEVDDAELQDEPLQIRLMDHDTYSANDAIGKVYINLNPLLLPGVPPTVKNIWTLEAAMSTNAGSQGGSVMTGWIPVYDTMHGIRGEVNVIVKVELFSDFNKFRQSSCGVQFFYSPNIPYGYHAQSVHGFVEELVVSDDPEYKWIDKIRTPRASNEARQTLFFKLSGEVQRKIGLKALDLGGNAVIGYLQNFDLEGESGIVARGIGTAVTLVKSQDIFGFPLTNLNIDEAALPFLPPSRAQPERAAAEESVPATPPDPHAIDRTPRRHVDPVQERDRHQPRTNPLHKKSSESYSSLTESIIDNESLRLMLALEDIRGLEGNRSKLDVRIRDLRRFFGPSEGDSGSGSPRLGRLKSRSSSARSSVASITYSVKEKGPKTPGEGIAGLLIKSIHTVPLDEVVELHEVYGGTGETEERKEEEERQKKEEGGQEEKLEAGKEPGSSVEENTQSSDNERSSSAGYDVLRDSALSVEEEMVVRKYTKPLTRAVTFPLPKFRSWVRSRLHRIDSDTRPLKESNNSLAKCLSTSQIQMSVLRPLDRQDTESKDQTELKEARKEATEEFPGETDDFSLPIATSTPVENRPPFFSSAEERKALEERSKEILQETRLEEESKEEERGKYAFRVDSIDADNKEDETSYQDETEGSVSAYSLLPSASDLDTKSTAEKPEEQKRESFRHKRPPLKIKLHTVESSTPPVTSARSLPSLRHLPLKTDGHKHLPETPSSVESLLRSSSAETFDAGRNQRRARMLDLLRLIDTELLVQEPRSPDSRPRRRRRDRNHVLHSTSHPRIHRSRHRVLADVIRVSSIPTDLSRPSQGPLGPRTDSSSFQSSQESISTRSTVIHARLRRSGHLSRSGRSLHGRRPPHEAPRAPEVACPRVRGPRGHPEARQAPRGAAGSPKRAQSERSRRRAAPQTPGTNDPSLTDDSSLSPPTNRDRHLDEGTGSPSCPVGSSSAARTCQSPASRLQTSLQRRSSDSDLSVTPKGNSLGGSDRSTGGGGRMGGGGLVRTMNQEALEMLEYPFITMQQYPPGFIIHIGGLVSSRSVKLLERISNPEEPEGRDAWWTEIRMEVRSHARALACNVVIGYREETSICDDVCVLNASGTAAVINLHTSAQETDSSAFTRLPQPAGQPAADQDRDKSSQKSSFIRIERSEGDTSVPCKSRHLSEGRSDPEGPFPPHQTRCSLCHLPYSEASVPFRVSVAKCGLCRRAKVPDVLFTTVELPESMPTGGRGCLVQASVCKNKKDLRGELNAKEISDCLPFLEYELHSLLLNKLKVKGMNAIFGLRLQVSVGERLIVGMAVGTAVFLTALPAPTVPQIASGNSWHNDEQLAEIQKNLVETVRRNREFYRLKPLADVENGRLATASDTDESDEELPAVDFSIGTRDACVLEVDDIEDMDRISLLVDDRPPDDFHVVNTQTIPGLEDLEIVRNLQMFTQISRAKIRAGQFASMPSKHFARLLQSVYFKLRRMVPCALCDMQFKLALPEPDEIQFTVVGMALGLGDPVKLKTKKKLISHSVSKDQVKKTDDDMIFSLDVDHTEVATEKEVGNTEKPSILSSVVGLKSRPRSPMRNKPHTTHRHKHVPLKGRYGVDITPLSYLPGGRIERYLGNLNFFFIRESTSIRENGGLSGFTHSFVMEVLAIVRAHITALGGNAMVAFFMTQCVLLHSPHKNQGQCLINVGGDVVSVSYFSDEKPASAQNC